MARQRTATRTSATGAGSSAGCAPAIQHTVRDPSDSHGSGPGGASPLTHASAEVCRGARPVQSHRARTRGTGPGRRGAGSGGGGWVRPGRSRVWPARAAPRPAAEAGNGGEGDGVGRRRTTVGGGRYGRSCSRGPDFWPRARCRPARLESDGYPTQRADLCILSDSIRSVLSQGRDTEFPGGDFNRRHLLSQAG